MPDALDYALAQLALQQGRVSAEELAECQAIQCEGGAASPAAGLALESLKDRPLHDILVARGYLSQHQAAELVHVAAHQHVPSTFPDAVDPTQHGVGPSPSHGPSLAAAPDATPPLHTLVLGWGEERLRARCVVAWEWVTEEQLKNALLAQATDVTPAGPPSILKILVDLGFLAQDRAEDVAQACVAQSGAAVSGDSVSIDGPNEEIQQALEVPGNRYGHLVRVSCIGQGGLGSVWRAWDRNLRRWVAMKFVDASWRHLLKEARVIARLEHPHIVPVHEVHAEDGGEAYLVMKLVPGGTLEERAGRVTPEEAAAMLLPVVRAVQFAHDKGVLHRDLKPRNILVEADGKTVVSDFGLARGVDPFDATQTGTAGTPAYMPPELVLERGAGPSASTDIYGLGATLYHLLTGRPPYPGVSLGNVLTEMAKGPPPVPRSINPDMPPDLERIVLRAMARDPDNRYRSAEDMAADLERYLRQERVLGQGEEVFADAISLLHAGRFEASELRLRRVMNLPWAPGVTGAPGDLMLDQLEEQDAVLTAALQHRPTHPAALRHRGLLRFARVLLDRLIGRSWVENLDRSVRDLQGAVAASPQDPEVRELLEQMERVRRRFLAELDRG